VTRRKTGADNLLGQLRTTSRLVRLVRTGGVVANREEDSSHSNWQLQDAKVRFSEVVKRARNKALDISASAVNQRSS